MSWRKLIVTAGLTVLITALPGCRNKFDLMDRYLQEAHRLWGFNGVVAVTQRGDLLLAKGYGMADTAFGNPNTLTTKFFIGSITKQFTAAAILLLHERGHLQLTDPITRYLPDYPADPGDRITIHQLLTHTSGLPNYTDFPSIVLGRTIEVQPWDIVATFKSRPLDFEPGTGFHYSNSGYLLLGLIIEAVSGQSYEAFLHKEIFKPLGMLNSGYGRRVMGHPNRAEGYTIDAEGRLIGAVPISFSIMFSAGALYTTVEDMLKWESALLNGTLLSPYSVALMMTPYSDGYGYGWWLDDRYGRSHAFHDGFLDGFNCTYDRWLEDDLAVIVFSNDDEAPVRKIADGLAAIVFGKRPVIPVRKEAVAVEADRLRRFVGRYLTASGNERTVYLDNGRLYTFIGGGRPFALLPESERKFFFEKDNTETLTFESSDKGRIDAVIYSNGENRWRLERVNQPGATEDRTDGSDVQLSTEQLRALVGEYRLEAEAGHPSGAFAITVAICDAHLCAVVGDNHPVLLLARSDTLFYHPSSDFRMQFHTAPDGRLSSCTITMGDATVEAVRGVGQ